MDKPMIINISGPPACGKTIIATVIKTWCIQWKKDIYIEEEGIPVFGNKERADIQLYTKQTYN